MNKDKVRAKMVRKLSKSISKSAAKLAAAQGGAPLLGYALCTDSDLSHIYAAGFTEQTASRFTEPSDRLSPAEWHEQSVDSPLRPASLLLESLIAAHYDDEDDAIEPGDDHLRPWKKEIFFDILQVLEGCRRDGVFSPDTILLLVDHDPGEEFFSWMRDGVKRTNSLEVYSEWSRLWGREAD